MASTADLLHDAFDRVAGIVHQTLEGASSAQLTGRIGPDANTIAWLVWHLTRIQDDHVAAASGREQVWTAMDFAGRFALPFDRHATGYGHTSAEVAEVRAPSGLLCAYFDATHEQTRMYVETLVDADLDRIVDTSWDPPVTLGVRLVSVIADNLQHAGQAAFIRGALRP